MNDIRSTDYSKKGICEIPISEISHDTSWLILSDNKIREVPNYIKKLKNLTRLALNDNRIEKIDPAIGYCTNVSWIDLTRNKLTALPNEFGRLTKITGLGLSENEFDEIPECIFRLLNLRKFGFFSNRITYIPPSIQNLQSLVKVDLSNNQIEYIPEEFCSLRGISWLNLSNNNLKILPKGISRMIRLEELGLGSNALSALPDMSGLSRLRILPIFKNRLKSIHPSLFKLRSLEKLDFSDNFIEEFPIDALYAPSLRYLNLRNNHISRLSPFDLSKRHLSTISMLDISENCLKCLPFRFFKLFSETTTIRLGGNPYERSKDIIPTHPSLLQICFTKMLGSDHKAEPWIENIFKERHICDYCGVTFVVQPTIIYGYSFLDSEHSFVIEKVLCSARCRCKCSG